MSELKQDVEKTADAARVVEVQIDAATQHALGAVNRQASWMERHRVAALAIKVAIVVAALIAAIHWL